MMKIGIRKCIITSSYSSQARRSFQTCAFRLQNELNKDNHQKANLAPAEEQQQQQPKLFKNEKQYQFTTTASNASQQHESEYAIQKRLERIERIKASILGVLAVIAIIGGFEAYQNRARIKYYLFNEIDLSGFDESLKDIKKKTTRKANKKLAAGEDFIATNPNNSKIPGLYLVGNNSNKQLLNEDLTKVTHFKRHPWFDGKILKHVAIGEFSSLAIDSKGDLIQWGNGFKENSDPIITLKGQNLTMAKISNGVVYCLNGKGELLYMPEDSTKQVQTKKKLFGLYCSGSNVTTTKFATKVKFIKFDTGKEHLIALSKDQKVYISATGTSTSSSSSSDAVTVSSKGQFGLPQYSQFDPPPPVNQLIELTNLNYYKDQKQNSIRTRKFTKIASGDYHNLALDEFGAVWSWGVNTYGSLGHEINYKSEIIPIPRKIELNRAYYKRNELPQCIDIKAGGYSSFGTFKSSNIYNIFEEYVKNNPGGNAMAAFDPESSSTAFDNDNILYLGWGKCLNGQLGIGHYVHSQQEPVKLKSLQGLNYYNEDSGKVEKITVKDWSVGSKHSMITLTNNDVLAFGDNEFYQLGNGKRVKLATPSNIPKLIEPNPSTIDDKAVTGLKNKRLQQINNRLILQDSGFESLKGNKKIKNDNLRQKIVASDESSVIFYTQ